jgi:hypothetical protein
MHDTSRQMIPQYLPPARATEANDRGYVLAALDGVTDLIDCLSADGMLE